MAKEISPALFCTALVILPTWAEEAATDSPRYLLHVLPLAIGIGQTSTVLESCNLITGRLFSSLLTGSPVYYSGILTVTEKLLN